MTEAIRTRSAGTKRRHPDDTRTRPRVNPPVVGVLTDGVDFILEATNMTDLKWTENPPTEAGWYWQRLGGGTVRVVHVDWAKTDDSVTKFLAVVGYITGQGIGGGCGYMNGHVPDWAGPITPPEDWAI